jgi:hypothetical protein
LKHTIRRHKVDHRTGKPLVKIPDYVTNKKKKKTGDDKNAVSSKKVADNLQTHAAVQQRTSDDTNVIQIPDDELELPSTSGLIRGFQFSDDTNYDMSILMDIDEFSDFQLLSPGKEYEAQDDVNDTEQFSIIDASGESPHLVKFTDDDSNLNSSPQIFSSLATTQSIPT